LKGCLVNILLASFLGGMFYLYYQHISQKFRDDEQALLHRLKQADSKNKELAKMVVIGNSSVAVAKAKKTYYKIILNEAQNIVEFIGKKHLLNIKIIKDRLLLVVTPDINLQAIKARYGSQAFYKITKDDIKIAIYIPFIIKNAKNKNKQGILY